MCVCFTNSIKEVPQTFGFGVGEGSFIRAYLTLLEFRKRFMAEFWQVQGRLVAA